MFPKLLRSFRSSKVSHECSAITIDQYLCSQTLANLTEKLMHERVYNFLEQQSCFYNAQFGFHLNLSTNNALMSITENIQSQLDQNKFCAGVFADLKKSFDTVDHGILLKKLSHYGIRGIANEWFCSYLSKRKQYVIIGNRVSNLNEISTGVPQG